MCWGGLVNLPQVPISLSSLVNLTKFNQRKCSDMPCRAVCRQFNIGRQFRPRGALFFIFSGPAISRVMERNESRTFERLLL